MRILHIHCQSETAYGVERYVVEVCRALHSAGHHVALAIDSSRSGFDGLDVLRPHVAVYRLNQLNTEMSAEAVRAIEALIEIERPDVVNLHHMRNVEAVRVLPQLVPTVQYLHDCRLVCLGAKYHFWWTKACTRRLSTACLVYACTSHCATVRPNRLVSKLRERLKMLEASEQLHGMIVASQYMRSLLMLNGVAADRVAVVPLFTESSDTAPIGSSDDPLPVILFVGRLSREKGADHLLRALAPLTGSCKVVFVGDGVEQYRLKRLAVSQGLAGKVKFTGWLPIEEVNRYYMNAACVVMPSLWPEPFGLVGIEAMAHGRPVVAYDSGGIREWLQDGVTGYLVPCGDIVALRKAVAELINNPHRCDAMGLTARKVVETKFSKRSHLSRLSDVYKQVTSRTGQLHRQAYHVT